MAGLLIKQLPPELHRRLKRAAAKHRRSMAREALVVLEQGLGGLEGPPPPTLRGRFPLTNAWIRRAVDRGRA